MLRFLLLMSIVLSTGCGDPLSPGVPAETVQDGAPVVGTKRQPAWLDCSFNPRDYVPLGPRPVPERPNMRLKLTARVD